MSSSSSGSYRPPEWAVAPQSSSSSSSSPSPPTGWTLTEIKNGIEVGRYDLQSRSCWVIGRATDQVDIPSLHESLSRQHARIAFDPHGIPWLKDLKSTHGTKVNKRPLPPAACSSKQETNSTTAGSRGVRLFPGDVIQFGASTRLYLLDGGPPEYERGAVQAKKEQQQQQQQRKRQQQQQQQQQQESSIRNDGNDRSSGDSGGAMWGISMDDDDDDDDYYDDDDGLDGNGSSRSNKTLPMDVQVPEKYQKSLEKLNALKYKLSNLQTEDDRIRRKGELTDGQQKQLQKNSERELALRRQIVEQEGDLYDKIYPNNNDDRKKKNKRHKSKNNGDFVDEDDDDEYFDRTKKNKNREGTGGTTRLSTSIGEDEAESEQSLISKWKQLREDLNKKRNFDMPRATSKLTSLQQHLNRLEDDGDEEAFFVKNDVDLAKESLDKVQAAIRTIEKALGDAEKLLKIVNFKIQYDRDTGYIGLGPPPPSTTSATAVAAAASDTNQESMLPPNTSTTTMLPPSLPQGRKDKTIQQASRTLMTGETTISLPLSSDLGSNSNSNSGGFVMPPPPKKKRVLGPTMPPPSYRPSSNGDDFTKPTPGPTPGPTPAPNVYPSRTGTSSRRRYGDRNDRKSLNFENTPSTKPPLNRGLSSTVLTGTALGRSLKRALLKLQNEDDEEIHGGIACTDGTPKTITVRTDAPPNEGLRNNDGGIAAAFEPGAGSPIQQDNQPKRIGTDDNAATTILKAFSTSAGSTPNKTKDTAPRALIRGRCDYYNRFGPNWRIVLDQVELKRRPFPSEMKRRKRLRKHRESIWDRDTGGSRRDDGATPEGSLHITQGDRIEKVQLLAYGDMD